LWALPLYTTLKNIDSDIFYQRGATIFTFATAMAAKKYNRKFIWATASDMDCLSAMKQTAFDMASLKNKPLRSKLIKVLLTSIEKCLSAYGIKCADLIIAQTETQKNLLIKYLNIPNNKIEIIPNMHPVPPLKGKNSEVLMILWMANIKSLKQPELFVKLAEYFSGYDCLFTMVGANQDKALYETVSCAAQALPNLRFLGSLCYEDALSVLDEASIFVNTSLLEGFPNTFIEAWMREVPTVSLNVDPDDVIKKNRLGFHSRTFDQLIKDIKFLIYNRDVLREMGVNARKYAVRVHDIDQLMPKYFNHFNRHYGE
jgi:glycosyltransferase involved in cell wall biosynthesis